MEKIIAIIPAHNEEKNIRACIEGLQAQSLHTDILVVCDNCIDRTEEIANSMGAQTFITKNNRSRKAGALNQAIMSMGVEYKYILSMDADTIIDLDLVKEAINILNKYSEIGAVCSRAGIQDFPATVSWLERILWHIQHLEYGAFDSYRVATLGEIKVVHGMAAVWRSKVLREVMDYRKQRWGIDHQIWDETNKTEDYELTICIKELGYGATMSLNMLAWTEVPLNWKKLWRQRVRWFSGGIDTLIHHGWNWTTAREVFMHASFWFMTFIQMILLSLVMQTVISGGSLVWNWITFVVYGIVTFEGIYRMRYVQGLKIGDVLIRLSLIPELLYAWFYISQQFYAYYESFIKRSGEW
jgi:biofilm PGA synthesis N-glycosyltransferase PgaC